MAQRRTLLPIFSLVALVWTLWCCAELASPAENFTGAASHARAAANTRTAGGTGRGNMRTALLAKAAEGEADSVEVSGFAGFVVGLALLPHVVYALVVAFNIVFRGESFGLGPFGLEIISCTTALGLTLWSLGSFVQRGRGLPAGPLGLLGLSEGLSYLAALSLVIATVATGFRGSPTPSSGGSKSAASSSFSAPTLPTFTAPSMPSLPSVSMPKVPDFKAPSFKVPDAPKFSVPDFKVPDVKVPDIKIPEIPKLPKFDAPKGVDSSAPKGLQALQAFSSKLSEVKVPDLPDIKIPEVKIPEPAKKAPEPAKKAPEAAKPASKKSGVPDYDMLFD